MLTVGDKFPEFSAKACVSTEKGKEFTTLTHKSYEGKWVIYYFYPKDFTFVCPTEIVEFDKHGRDFADRDCVVIGGSTDNEFSHLAWRKDHADLRSINHPLIAAQHLARNLGIQHPTEGVCLRATFVVDPAGVIQWASANPLAAGRSVAEVMRVVDAIQTGELCPCDWKAGQPTLSTKK
jgi:peroxiredoxin (alkyl hydroperoxide reductase subunit C)